MTRDEFLKAVMGEYSAFPPGGYFTFNPQEKLIDSTLKVAGVLIDRWPIANPQEASMRDGLVRYLDALRTPAAKQKGDGR